MRHETLLVMTVGPDKKFGFQSGGLSIHQQTPGGGWLVFNGNSVSQNKPARIKN